MPRYCADIIFSPCCPLISEHSSENGNAARDARFVQENLIPASADIRRMVRDDPGQHVRSPDASGGAALAMTSRRAHTLPFIRTRIRKLLKRNRESHMNFGNTLVHNASVDLINLLCG